MNEPNMLVWRLLIVILALSLGGSALALTDFDSVGGLWWSLLLSVLVFIIGPWWLVRFLRRVRRDSQQHHQTKPQENQHKNEQRRHPQP